MIFTPEQVRAFFQGHWTVRKYKSFALPPEHLEVILEAAQRAPTDATAQMYSLIRLTDIKLRKQIAELCTNPHVETASEAFLICADIHRLEEILKSHHFVPGEFPHIAIHFAIGDAVLAGQNLLIAAEMLGYRGCWIGGVINAPDEIAELVRLPSGVFPFAALTLGLPDEDHRLRPRLPRDQVVHENFYRSLSSDELQQGIEQMGSISARGNWAQTLARYFAKGGTMEMRESKIKALLERMIFRKTKP